MTQLDLDLCYLTATEAIARFKARTLSPVELTSALIARSQALNPTLNVLTELKTEAALAAARVAEGRYSKAKSARPRPLEGVPVAIKDFHSVKDERTTYGSKAYADFKPAHSAPTVARLLDAGAILLSRTTTPELAHGGITKSPLWGVSRNPWNPQYTCGGSSGGSGAAVAAGMTTIADGTDGGGSIRIPAALNGIFGYKPPFGRNPVDLDHPLETLLHYGPMTRSVADAALMQNVMSGQHVMDICSLRESCVLPEKFAAIRGLKIAVSMDLGYVEVADDVQKNTREAIAVLKRLGAKVEEVDLGWNDTVLDAWQTWWEGLFAGLCGDLLPRWRHHLTPLVEQLLESGLRHSGVQLYKTNLVRGWMYQTLGPILEKYDALVCPTLAVSCLDAEHDDMAKDFRINGKKVPAYVGWAMTYPFNLMGWCPVASVPTGFGSTDMPTGMQIVGRTFDDPMVFRIASAFEAARPWRGNRPAI